MRDTQLDIYRALLMLYIPCVTHVMYWLGDGREPYLSLLLVEMPLIFFVSGASLSVSRSKRGLLQTIINRFKRVIAPYYIYAAVLIAIGLVITLVNLAAPVFPALDITRYGWKDIAAILLCKDIPQFPFIWHLWFIPPYLILSCTFPLQIKLMGKVGDWVYFALCLGLFLLAQFTEIALLRHVLCYNVFMVCGYLFYRRIKTDIMALAAIAALAIVLLGVLLLGVDFCPMQGHKFPPDWLFVMYNLFVLCLVSLVFSHFTIKNNRIFQLWSERGYNIYLYQSVVFVCVHLLRQHTYGNIPLPLVKALMDAGLVFLLSTGLSFLTYPVERFVMKKLRL